MKKYNYTRLTGLVAGISKVAFVILIMDLFFIVTAILITGKFMDVFAFMIVSQIVGVLGSVFIGFPVVIMMNKFGNNNNAIAAFICSGIIFLAIFFLMGDGGYPKRSIKILVFFASYGFVCGYLFNRSYKIARYF